MTKERFTTSVGRLVQGDVDTAQDKDASGNPRVVKSGPNAGQPNPQYFIAVAFPKADPTGGFGQFYGKLLQKAAQDFPALFPDAHAGDYTCTHPKFAFKVVDGDGVDDNGKPNNTKPGFAGHWVVRFSSGYPPRIFDAGRYGPHDQIQEKGFIKRGYYVRVSGSVEGNGDANKPGLYLNLDMVERSAFGEEIRSGPDAGEAFGGGPAALPTGASATPVGGPPASPAAGNAAPAAPPAASPAAAPTAPVAPASPAAAPQYTGYMAPNGAQPAAAPSPPPAPGTPAAPSAPPATASPTSPPPAPAAPPPPPAAPAGPVMTAAANGATYEQMIAAGWTDETLRAHGMIV